MIIILNGTSSAGKSSIAEKLIDLSKDKRYFFFSVDNFLIHSIPLDINMEIKEDLELLDKAITGFNLSLGPLSAHIPNMIIDHVLQQENWHTEMFSGIKNIPHVFVHITAPLEVIENREKNRSDRKQGTAKAQYDQMFKYNYDLVIDTSINTPEQGAQVILNFISKL